VTSNEGRGGRRYLPFAFTEHGAIMAATVQRAIEMSIFVVRAFVGMREALAANQQIAAKLSELERRLESHDTDIQELIYRNSSRRFESSWRLPHEMRGELDLPCQPVQLRLREEAS